MARLVNAGKQFLDDVSNALGAHGEPYGDPDGIGRLRSVSFDAENADYLKDVVEALNDPRIVDSRKVSNGRLIVTFSPKVVSDTRDPYAVGKAVDALGVRTAKPGDVLSEVRDEDDADDAKPVKKAAPAKKQAAKKAAKKS